MLQPDYSGDVTCRIGLFLRFEQLRSNLSR